MSASACNLSSINYGYDIVLALTQEHINTGLKEYLQNGNQPVCQFCFIPDPTPGNPLQMLTLDQFKTLASGVDPFAIKDITDSNVSTVTKAGFVCGVEIQIGLPPGVEPKHLPFEIVTLGSDAHNVLFTMYCSRLSVIEYSPPSATATQGAWNVWTQPQRQPWYIQSSVNLTQGKLTDLNTPFFNNFPQQRAAIQTQLNNLGDSTFSLQHLMFDLENATPSCPPSIEGVPPNTAAAETLQRCFVSLWTSNAKVFGEPPIWVAATAQNPSNVPFSNWPTATPAPSNALTSIEPMVHPPLIPNSIVPVQNPSSDQLNLSTLDYLCMIDGHPQPSPSPFTWNWVDIGDKNNVGGVIAIKRDIIASYIQPQLTSYLHYLYWDPHYADDWVAWKPMKNAGSLIKSTLSGPHVIQSSATSSANFMAKDPKPIVQQADYTVTCDVMFDGTEITVVQDMSLVLYVPVKHGSVHSTVDYKIALGNTSVHTVSVGLTGCLEITMQQSSPRGVPCQTDDQFQQWGFQPDVMRMIPILYDQFAVAQKPITFTADSLNSFSTIIFPGGKTFMYSDATFSDNQDLICSIQYAEPPSVPEALQVSSVMVPSMEMESVSSVPLQNTQTVSAVPSRISWSSEMMQNYIQADLLSPQSNFEALQTDDGHSLLFAINPAGALTVIREVNEATRQIGDTAVSGWNINDLSSIIASGTKLSSFGVGQSFSDGTINLAIAVTSGSTNLLYLSLGNSSSDFSWISQPQWKCYPFDAVDKTISVITIVGVLFAETDDKQLIIVDIDQPTDSAAKNVARYHVDPSPKHGHSWEAIDLPVDLGSESYISCQGRKMRDTVDGIYTSGTFNQQAVLVYQPVKNVLDSGPPLSVNFSIPNGTATSAIAAAQDVGDPSSESYGTTALFAISGSTLYCFSADNQGNGAVATVLLTDPILEQTSQILAMMYGDVITLWGLNNTNTVYYTSCPTDQYLTATAWSTPMPIATDVQGLTAYSNRVDGGNTIFLNSSGTLKKLVQATSESKMWKVQDMYIVASEAPKALSFNSYTTTVQVAGGSAATLSMATQSRSPVYINGAYYVLGPDPTQVTTNSLGLMTIIEPTENVNGTAIAVKLGSEMKLINPMKKTFAKLTSLNTAASLRSANIPSKTVAGGIQGAPPPTSLISSTTSDDDVGAVTTNLASLQTAYKNVSQPAPTTTALFSFLDDISDVGDALESVAGDVYRGLKSVGDAVINGIHRLADGVWHFIAKIGGKLYKAALTTIDAVVGAVEWVFKAVETVVEDIIKFIEMLLEWDDITRTKNVLHNVIQLCLYNIQDEIPTAQNTFDSAMSTIQSKIDTLTGVEWSLPEISQPASASARDPHKGQTSSSMLFAHHFQNQASNVTMAEEPSLDEAKAFLGDLTSALDKEKANLSEVISQLKQLATSFSSLTVAEILKKVVGIISSSILSSVGSVGDAIFSALQQAGDVVTSVLNCKIHIPIISDILNAIGIADITFLDLFSWIAAVAYTVVYKIANDGDAPFPDNDSTNNLIGASIWGDLATQFKCVTSDITSDTIGGSSSSGGEQTVTSSLTPKQISINHFLHDTTGVLALCNCIVQPLAMIDAQGNKLIKYGSTALSVFEGICSAAAGFLSPRDPLIDPFMVDLSTTCSKAAILSKCFFSGQVMGRLFPGTTDAEAAQMAAWVDLIYVLGSLVPTCWHLHELCGESAGTDREAAVFGEIRSTCSYVSRIAFAVAVTDKVFLPDGAVVVGLCSFAIAGMEAAMGQVGR